MTTSDLPALRPATTAEAPSEPSDGLPAPLDVEREFVLLGQKGDRVAFEQLVRRTARLVYSRLYLETGDPHTAEDLTQETYLVAWKNLHQMTEASGFRPWLFSIARTVAIDAGRRAGRKKRGPAGARAAGEQALGLVADAGPSPPDLAELAEERARVLDLLRMMPEAYREPLMLRYLGGADYDEIGRQLGLTNGSLRGLLNRGMSKLREMLRPQDE